MPPPHDPKPSPQVGSQEAPKTLPESTQAAPRRHPSDAKEPPRAPRRLQEVLGAKR